MGNWTEYKGKVKYHALFCSWFIRSSPCHSHSKHQAFKKLSRLYPSASELSHKNLIKKPRMRLVYFIQYISYDNSSTSRYNLYLVNISIGYSPLTPLSFQVNHFFFYLESESRTSPSQRKDKGQRKRKIDKCMLKQIRTRTFHP